MDKGGGMLKGNTQDVDFRTLDSLFGFRLRRAQIKLFQHFRSSLAEFDITPGQAGILILIRDNPGISQSDLARAVHVERATLGQTVDVLVRRGLVLRARNRTDKRAYALRLTKTGAEFVSRLIPAIQAHEADIGSTLDDADYRRLHDLLTKFLNA